MPVAEAMKAQLFLELLRRGDLKDVIVFTRTKHRANRLHEFLQRHRISSERIHGNRSQAQRTQALAGFKAGEIQVLVATDIVARGIDVEELSHVVNFDVPHLPEDYVHRVGRTARAEATGDAYTFVSPEEEGDLRATMSVATSTWISPALKPASACVRCACERLPWIRSDEMRCRCRNSCRRFARCFVRVKTITSFSSPRRSSSRKSCAFSASETG